MPFYLSFDNGSLYHPLCHQGSLPHQLRDVYVDTASFPIYSVHATSPYDIWWGGEDGFVYHLSSGVDVKPASVGKIKAMFGGEYIPLSIEENKEKITIGK